MMKKSCKVFVVLFSLGVLAGCSRQGAEKTPDSSSAVSTQQVSASSSSEKASAVVKISIKVDGQAISAKEVTIKEGALLMAVLKENFEISEDNGMVTTIDGVTQNEGDNADKWWMYQVNGTDAAVGAADYPLKAGDQVEFELRDFS